jgi:hypothetical protein
MQRPMFEGQEPIGGMSTAVKVTLIVCTTVVVLMILCCGGLILLAQVSPPPAPLAPLPSVS